MPMSAGNSQTPSEGAEIDGTDSRGLITQGSAVVLRKLVKGRQYHYKQATVQPDARVDFKGLRGAVHLGGLVGRRFGELFTIGGNRSLVPVTDASEFDQFEDHIVAELNQGCGGEQITVGQRDNRGIMDSAVNQTMSAETLSELRDSGESGRSVISKLVEGSATFEQKTSFSQEKYVRKKKEKYLDYIAVLEPSVRVLSELRGKGTNLRFDILSQMLAYGNVHCATRALVVDDSVNLLLAQAACERLLGDSGGLLCLLTPTAKKPAGFDALQLRCRQLIGDSCYGNSGVAGIHWAPLGCTRAAAIQMRNGKNAAPEEDPDAKAEESTAKRIKFDTGIESTDHVSDTSVSDLLSGSEWDSLLVASGRYNPVCLAPLLALLGPGKPFVFHSDHQDALVTLAGELGSQHGTGRGLAGPLLLFDSFCRPWQLLAGRCRPAMRMEAMGSGFVLTGRVGGDSDGATEGLGD